MEATEHKVRPGVFVGLCLIKKYSLVIFENLDIQKKLLFLFLRFIFSTAFSTSSLWPKVTMA